MISSIYSFFFLFFSSLRQSILIFYFFPNREAGKLEFIYIHSLIRRGRSLRSLIVYISLSLSYFIGFAIALNYIGGGARCRSLIVKDTSKRFPYTFESCYIECRARSARRRDKILLYRVYYIYLTSARSQEKGDNVL